MRLRALASIVACLLVVLLSSSAQAQESAQEVKKGLSLTEAGLVTFGVAYGWSAATGAVYRDSSERVIPTMFVPVAGPIMALHADRHEIEGRYTFTGRMIEATGANSCSGDGVICGSALPFIPVAIVEYLMIYGASLTQAAGLVMALVGTLKEDQTGARDHVNAAAARPAASSRPKIAISPSVPGGLGLSLSVTQW